MQIVDGQQDPNRETGRAQLSAPLFISVDTDPPSEDGITFDMLDSSDSGMSMDDYVTNIIQPAFDGTVDPGAKVRIYAAKIINNVVQTPELIGQGTATAAGNFEITVEPLVDAIYDISLELEDAAGNVGVINPDLGVCWCH